ncbi:MAG: hypothetical protein C0467_25505 [Planctomycetaceae bacterium]|nr:hypothetical protein [Planctomycetaceae bacterium]
MVANVILAFIKYASVHYRDEKGKPTGEVEEFRAAYGPLMDLYGHIPAAEFGPLAMQAVRQKMIDNDWCRNRVNKQVSRIRRIFKWAASQELVPVELPHGLACVQGLQRGRTTARESDPVLPVDREVVEKTLPFVSRQVRTMVRLQLLTGMRPGEVCGMKWGLIDRTGEMWVYRPVKHKTAHHGKARTIAIGPKAKELLLEYIGDKLPNPGEPIFSPKDAREERYQAMRDARVSKVQPSQANRRKKSPTRAPGTAYTSRAYNFAIYKAAEKAGVPNWSPNRLRHTFGTEVRKAFGLEAAQVLLGHSKADVTQVYAARDLALASKVANEVG